MIELGSQLEPLTSSLLILLIILKSVSSLLQLLGGAANAEYTAFLFHTIPANGFWCSCGKPSVCPISCTIVSIPLCLSCVATFHPKFIVLGSFLLISISLPTYDHEPSSCINAILMLASSLFFTSLNFNPIPTASQILNPLLTAAIWCALPFHGLHSLVPSLKVT